MCTECFITYNSIQAYTWDHRGNLLADGAFTYTYNSAGRMVRAESITATLAYTYTSASLSAGTADGLRVARSQSVSSVESVDLFTWDWATLVPELLSDGDSLYLIGYDTLGWQTADGLAPSEAEGWTFVLPDALGSVRQELDAAGAVIAVREWSPYGEELGGAQAGLGFTGEWYDAAVGLTYLRARWLDSYLSQFVSQDPFPGLRTQPFSLHPYVYVLASPINATDPSGWYHRDVHFDLTKNMMLAMAMIYFPMSEAEKLAGSIAKGDQYVDDSWQLRAIPVFGCMECHFSPFVATISHVNKAIELGDPFLWGYTPSTSRLLLSLE